MDIQLLQEVRDQIRQNPHNFDMSATIEDTSIPDFLSSREFCGTSACIAGFACILKDYGYLRGGVMDQAQLLLELSQEQRSKLFYDGEWDEPYRTRYGQARTPQERAEVAAQYIDHFVVTYDR